MSSAHLAPFHSQSSGWDTSLGGAFANRVLKWVNELVDLYKRIEGGEEARSPPQFQSWLGGSAGSGKSTTLKTVVQHARLITQRAKVPAKIELTAYTGVAAFNIGFGARTACSAFRIFPNAKWKPELEGDAFRKLEDVWADVVLLIVDEVSFIGKAFFARMHHRMQQGRRQHFSKYALDPARHIFGACSVVLVGDFGQLEPIGDWSMVDTEMTYATCPTGQRNLWKHAQSGALLVRGIGEAILLNKVHRSKDDVWWTQSCLRLRDFIMTQEEDHKYWMTHDLDRGHLDREQKEYFEQHAVWLCARCQDVGTRNGRKMAQMAERDKALIHQIHAEHGTRTGRSSRSAKNLASSAFDGLRAVVNLVRGCKVMVTRNIAYRFGLANGTRGTLVGVVYGPGGARAVGRHGTATASVVPTERGPSERAPLARCRESTLSAKPTASHASWSKVRSMPEALVLHVPDYCGPEFYPGQRDAYWKSKEPRSTPRRAGCKRLQKGKANRGAAWPSRPESGRGMPGVRTGAPKA